MIAIIAMSLLNMFISLKFKRAVFAAWGLRKTTTE